ncbi:MAG: flagellar hook-basal body complex protein [Planctomycetota bacterium]|jgi:flagellar hook-basal body protein|nr:flagellar hook-basal body complex protein [Planctomycetota bacterium]
MGLSQALSTGISGLITHQKAMDNVGNNLANVNTVGFKKGIFQFRTLLEQTFRGGMGADAQTGRGSVNPVQVGLGTQTGSINKVFTQGPLENTANPNDMALMGNGFFVLSQGNGYVYTRDGSFYIGSDGSLMGGDGLFVQGAMAVKDSQGGVAIPADAKLENIIIPIGAVGGMSQTSKVEFKGNLNSNQELSSGLQLFGGVSYPTVGNLQQWMAKADYNGGDPLKDAKVDTSWNALEEKSYLVSQEMLAYARSQGVEAAGLPANVGSYTANITAAGLGDTYAYQAIDLTDPASATYGQVVDVVTLGLGELVKVDDLLPLGYVPVVEEIKTVNGGNVQTSTALGVKIPQYLSRGASGYFNGEPYTVENDYTFPPWVYESNGGDFLAAAGTAKLDGEMFTDAELESIWGAGSTFAPNGYVTVDDAPRPGETYPANLNTPLEQLQYLKGNVWTQPFANVKNGDEITIAFEKGSSKVEAVFVYNRPGEVSPMNPPQQPVGIERSYTLEHFLKFLGGDVDEPTSAFPAITPAMYGAPVTGAYPEGDMSSPDFDRAAYELALRNVAVTKSARNLDQAGGAMGLLSLPPRISSTNYGPDDYDAPGESAGAYTRSGVSPATYERWDANEGKMVVRDDIPSFNVSFVANLGAANAISDIGISFNNVPHDAMFSAEQDYSAPQGGSASATMTFYDSLGNPKTAAVRLAMVSQDSDFTTWRWYADCADDSDFPWQADPATGEIISNLNVGTGLIRFDKNGNFVKGAEYSETQGIVINQSDRGVNEPIWIKMLNNLSSDRQQDLDFSFLTMSAAASDLTLKYQNGAPPGTLDSYQVSLDGLIQGVYSNGIIAPIARLVLALIPNMNGLISAGDNLFFTGPASGDAQYGYANVGGRGEVRQMQLETSNVDLSEEFTKLITVERGFQANSRTITTADEMLQELLNLKR